MDTQRLTRKKEELQQQWDLLSEKIARLRRDMAIEVGTAMKFQLEKQLEQAEQDRSELEKQLNDLESKLHEDVSPPLAESAKSDAETKRLQPQKEFTERQPENFSLHIFISYSHDDKEYTHRLAESLEEAGFRVWIDDRVDYGSEWPKEIEKHLEKCSVFMLIMTPRSYESTWVQNELAWALQHKKPIFPLLLEGAGSWFQVASIQYVDVRGGKLPPEKFYGRVRRKLSNQIVLEEKVEEEVDQIEEPVKEEHPVRETPRREPLWVEGERQKKNNHFIQRIAIAVVIAGVIFFGGWGLVHWTTRPGKPISVLFEYTKTPLIFISTPTPPPIPTLSPSTPTPTPTRILTTTPTFTPLPPTPEVYSVQVSSSLDKRDAERLQQQYGQLGYLAYISPADLGEKGIWYRVHVGNLQTLTEAEILKEELLEKAPGLTNDPFVIKVSVTEELIPRPKSGIRLRSEPLTVSQEEAKEIFGLDTNWRPLKYTENDFEDLGEVVVDHAAGLMWQKSGSPEELMYADAQKYVEDLNRQKFAGYDDWRLPTIRELLTLVEEERQSNYLYISPIFETQRVYWSTDMISAEWVWAIDFVVGDVGKNRLSTYAFGYVRAVRP